MANQKNLEFNEKLSNIFTKEKIRLMKALYSESIFSVGELADYLKRDISAVYRDLKKLQKHGLVALKKDGRSVQPVLENAQITLSFGKNEKNDKKDSEINYIG